MRLIMLWYEKYSHQFSTVNICIYYITKFGEKGLINLGKLVPGVGAVISGGFDLVETKLIADRAYRWFFEGDFSVEKGQAEKPENTIDVEII